MYPLRCSVLHQKGVDQIHIDGNPVYLNVYLADGGSFYPEPCEKQYYAEYKGVLLVFETTGYKPLINPFYAQGLYAAINWYARTELKSEVKISLTDPRRGSKNHFLS